MDAARVARLLEQGEVTPALVLRAAALGLLPAGAVPPGAGDPIAAAANLGALRAKAVAALLANDTDLAQDETIRAEAQAVVDSQATSLTQTQLIAVLKDLARGLVILAGNDVNTKKELNALIRLVVGELDSTDGT